MASQEKSYETMSKWGSSVQRRILVEDTNSNFNCMIQRGDKDPWGQVSSVPIPVTVHYKLLKTLDINLITNCRRPPFTVTSFWVELSRPSYFELAVPNDPRRSSPPDAKVEVAESISRILNGETSRFYFDAMKRTSDNFKPWLNVPAVKRGLRLWCNLKKNVYDDSPGSWKVLLVIQVYVFL